MKAAIALIGIAGFTAGAHDSSWAAGAPVTDRIMATAADDYADCLAKHDYRKIAEVLDSGFDAAFDKALNGVQSKRCVLTGDARPSNSVLRGSLFAAMYRRFGPQAGRSASNIAKGWLPKLPTADPRYAWYVLSGCMVQREPGATRLMIREPIGSDVAARQKEKIIAALPSCLPANSQVRVNLTELTRYLAETLYQIDFAAPSGERKRFWSRAI